jgi:FkbM family methyltransferase
MRKVKAFQVAEHPQFRWFWDDVESGKWEPHTFEVLDKYLGLDTTYLDLGAWIGPTVLHASTLCGRCLAVEPDPEAFTWLCENTKGTRIETHRLAISDHNGVEMLGSEELGNSMTRLSATANRIEVPCQTLTSFCAKTKISGPLFIKIDVEGSEEAILRDFAFFVVHRPTVYLSLHHQWFLDPATAMKTINRVGDLYKTRTRVEHNSLLFTDL